MVWTMQYLQKIYEWTQGQVSDIVCSKISITSKCHFEGVWRTSNQQIFNCLENNSKHVTLQFRPDNNLEHCFILEYKSRLKERFNFTEILTIHQIGSLFSSIAFRLLYWVCEQTPSGMLSKTTCFMKTLPLVTISLGIPNSGARRV